MSLLYSCNRPVASQWFTSGGISDLRTAQSSVCDEVLPICRPDPPRVAARHWDVRCLQAMAPCAACAPARRPPYQLRS